MAYQSRSTRWKMVGSRWVLAGSQPTDSAGSQPTRLCPAIEVATPPDGTAVGAASAGAGSAGAASTPSLEPASPTPSFEIVGGGARPIVYQIYAASSTSAQTENDDDDEYFRMYGGNVVPPYTAMIGQR